MIIPIYASTLPALTRIEEGALELVPANVAVAIQVHRPHDVVDLHTQTKVPPIASQDVGQRSQNKTKISEAAQLITSWSRMVHRMLNMRHHRNFSKILSHPLVEVLQECNAKYFKRIKHHSIFCVQVQP